MSESEGTKSDAALGCSACGSQNPPDHRFCGACGATLDQTLASGIRREVERQIGVRLKDAQIVEFEVSEKILTRLVNWAKLFGVLVGAPLVLGGAILGYLGYDKYRIFKDTVLRAEQAALEPLKKTRDEATRQNNELEARLKQNQALTTQVQQLSDQVQQLAKQIVKFKPSVSFTPELQQNLAGKFNELLSNVVDRPVMIRRLPWVGCHLSE
jgi:hypothetical protein